jgi:hypothetical protein
MFIRFDRLQNNESSSSPLSPWWPSGMSTWSELTQLMTRQHTDLFAEIAQAPFTLPRSVHDHPPSIHLVIAIFSPLNLMLTSLTPELKSHCWWCQMPSPSFCSNKMPAMSMNLLRKWMLQSSKVNARLFLCYTCFRFIPSGARYSRPLREFSEALTYRSAFAFHTIKSIRVNMTFF